MCLRASSALPIFSEEKETRPESYCCLHATIQYRARRKREKQWEMLIERRFCPIVVCMCVRETTVRTYEYVRGIHFWEGVGIHFLGYYDTL